MTAEVHITVAARLKLVDQRYTRSRQSLVELLVGAGRPLTIPEVLTSRPDLPQSSVYRNLAVLEQAAAVRRVMGSDEFARYELAEEITGHHHHLVCEECGDITDFRVPDSLERAMHRAFADIEAEQGFRPDSHRLDLVGLCTNCRAGAGSGSGSLNRS